MQMAGRDNLGSHEEYCIEPCVMENCCCNFGNRKENNKQLTLFFCFPKFLMQNICLCQIKKERERKREREREREREKERERGREGGEGREEGRGREGGGKREKGGGGGRRDGGRETETEKERTRERKGEKGQLAVPFSPQHILFSSCRQYII